MATGKTGMLLNFIDNTIPLLSRKFHFRMASQSLTLQYLNDTLRDPPHFLLSLSFSVHLGSQHWAQGRLLRHMRTHTVHVVKSM